MNCINIIIIIHCTNCTNIVHDSSSFILLAICLIKKFWNGHLLADDIFSVTDLIKYYVQSYEYSDDTSFSNLKPIMTQFPSCIALFQLYFGDWYSLNQIWYISHLLWHFCRQTNLSENK